MVSGLPLRSTALPTESRTQLLVNRLFGAPTRLLPSDHGNNVMMEGAYQQQRAPDGTVHDAYVFAAPTATSEPPGARKTVLVARLEEMRCARHHGVGHLLEVVAVALGEGGDGRLDRRPGQQVVGIHGNQGTAQALVHDAAPADTVRTR